MALSTNVCQFARLERMAIQPQIHKYALIRALLVILETHPRANASPNALWSLLLSDINRKNYAMQAALMVHMLT